MGQGQSRAISPLIPAAVACLAMISRSQVSIDNIVNDGCVNRLLARQCLEVKCITRYGAQ